MSEMHEVKIVTRQGAVLTTAMEDSQIRRLREEIGKDKVCNIIGTNNTTMLHMSDVTMVEVEGWKP